MNDWTIFCQTKFLLSFSIFYLIILVNALSDTRIILSYTIHISFSLSIQLKNGFFSNWQTEARYIDIHLSLANITFRNGKELRFSWNNQINIVSDFWKFLKIWESKEDIYLYRKTNHSIVQQNIDHHRYERRKSDDYRNFKSEFVNNLKLSQSLKEFWIQLIEFSIILDVLLRYHNYWKKNMKRNFWSIIIISRTTWSLNINRH